jgi:flavin-binding protein dodecin
MSSIAKIIEITASSKKSFEDAVRTGIARASKTVKGIKGAWVAEQKVMVEKNEVVEWRVTMKVSFVLE